MIAAFQLILPILLQIPSIIQFVEALHGAGNGDVKLQMAIDLISRIWPQIGQAMQQNPIIQTTLAAVIGTIVKHMNAKGITNPLGVQAAPAAPATSQVAPPNSVAASDAAITSGK